MVIKNLPRLAYVTNVTTLPCKTLMSENKRAINDKLQVNVTTYLRYGGVVNNQIKKCLLLSLPVNIFLKSVNIWQSYKQEGGCLMQFLRLLAMWSPGSRLVAFGIKMSHLNLGK